MAIKIEMSDFQADSNEWESNSYIQFHRNAQVFRLIEIKEPLSNTLSNTNYAVAGSALL